LIAANERQEHRTTQIANDVDVFGRRECGKHVVVTATSVEVEKSIVERPKLKIERLPTEDATAIVEK